jgi:hypothetical protein
MRQHLVGAAALLLVLAGCGGPGPVTPNPPTLGVTVAVSPASGPQTTTFTFTAHATGLGTVAPSALRFRWDYQNDGVWDTQASADSTTQTTFTSTGAHTVKVNVTDGARETNGTGTATVTSTVVTGNFVVLAWNDLGMHCLNPTYDQAVILPPYNTLQAQVVLKGEPPSVVTAGITVEYRIDGNTYSYGKTDSHGGMFAQFWDHVQELFGVSLAHNLGLNLSDPGLHNGLSGTMVARDDHFEVNGIPVVPVSDAGVWNPYQVAVITVKNSEGTVLTETRTTVPTSDEINCAKCHASGGTGTASIGGGGADVFANVLAVHDAKNGTNLVGQAPVLCASCHASPVLGTPSPAEPDMYLSASVHGAHIGRGAACYDCHPGDITRCSRSNAHTAVDGKCTTCHGAIEQVASSITSGGRVPWVDEPKCANAGCHTGVTGVDTGSTLFRNARGHGGLFCASCHGSPHAMVPSREASDNYQAIQYQGARRVSVLGSCHACHGNSRGDGSGGFNSEHGPGRRASACNTCHTAPTANNLALWPHGFTWKSR